MGIRTGSQGWIAFTAMVLMVVVGGCASPPPGEQEPEVSRESEREGGCQDGLDNDIDGFSDCDDPDCVSACRPEVSNGGGSDVGNDTTLAEDASPDDTGGLDTSEPPEDTTAAEDTTDDDDGDDAAEDTADDTGAETDVVDRDTELPDLPPVEGPGQRSCLTEIQIDPPGNPSQVHIAGPFNGWEATATPMTDADNDGVFTVELELAPGEHPYKFIVDGVWDWDGSLAVPEGMAADFYTQWSGGFENRNVIVGDCQVPLLETVSAQGGPDGVQARIRFWSAADGAPLDPESVAVTLGSEPHLPESIDVEQGVITINAQGLPPGKHSLRIRARDTMGRATEQEPHMVPLWVESEPFQWQDALMYFVFTDRFRDSDADNPLAEPIPGVPAIANYQGGDFKGVIDALEEGYFEAMGINLLWLSPVLENPEGAYIAADRVHQFSGFHGYWPTHPRQIEFRWGDRDGVAAERLKELIDKAHARGIRVMFDIVLNHVHEDHTYQEDFPAWFMADPCPCTTDPGACNWDTNPLFCWFIDYLPDLDFRNHDVTMQVSRDVEWLVTEFDVDAFRIDAAKHMHHIIMRRTAKRLTDRFEQGGGAPFYLVGETFTGADGHGLIMNYVAPWELDGQYDFPLLYPIRDSFAFDVSFRNLSERIRVGQQAYGEAYTWMSPFLGNHDIPRMATMIATGGQGFDPWNGDPDPMATPGPVSQWEIINRMSMGFAFVITQPGIPLIYYGDEIGLAGWADPDNRRMMSFEPGLSDNQRTLLARIQALGSARRDHEALRRGRFQELWVDDDLFIYARDNGRGDVAIVAMNKGADRIQQVPIPAELGLEGVSMTDTLAGERTVVVGGGQVTFTLDNWEYAIFIQ